MEEITAVNNPFKTLYLPPLLNSLLPCNLAEELNTSDMKPEQIQQLLDSTSILVETNSKLVENNCEAINLLKSTITKNEKLQKVSFQIFQSLSDKKDKSIRETSWHNTLQQILNPKA